MNKIYNNLTVENLIRTEDFKAIDKSKQKEIIENSSWFTQFNKYQQEQIITGIDEEVDISTYAKKEIHEDIMEEIFYALIEDIDIIPYVEAGFSNFQLLEIRQGLSANLDVSIYAKKEYSWEQIRWGLEANLDVSTYAKPNISHLQMDLMRIELLEEL